MKDNKKQNLTPMKRIIIATAVLLAMALPSRAQLNVSFLGLEMGKTYSQTDVMSEFGKPQSTDGQMWEDYMTLYYKDFKISFRDNGHFFSFTTTSPRHVLFKDLVDGGLKVGDPVSKIFRMKSAYPKSDMMPDSYRIFTKSDWLTGIIKYDRQSEKIISIKCYEID